MELKNLKNKELAMNIKTRISIRPTLTIVLTKRRFNEAEEVIRIKAYLNK